MKELLNDPKYIKALETIARTQKEWDKNFPGYTKIEEHGKNK